MTEFGHDDMCHLDLRLWVLQRDDTLYAFSVPVGVFEENYSANGDD